MCMLLPLISQLILISFLHFTFPFYTSPNGVCACGCLLGLVCLYVFLGKRVRQLVFLLTPIFMPAHTYAWERGGGEEEGGAADK